MAKPFAAYTKQQEKAIHQALKEAHLKSDADWHNRILPDITTLMVDLYEGASVPGVVAYATTKQRQLDTLITALDDAKRVYEQLGERYQWHLDDQLGPGQRLNLSEALDAALPAARLAAEKPNPHVHLQKTGSPRNHAMRLAVGALLEIFEKATGIEPKVIYAPYAKDNYDGNFYKFAVACLAPVRLNHAKSLGSAILAECKEWKRVEQDNRHPASKRAKIKK